MVQESLSLAVALGGAALIVCMYLRLHAFPRYGRKAIIAAAIGLFMGAKYLARATDLQDYVLALSAAGYLGYFG